ncbi:LytR family transcriptional attenuator [Tamaricihabitans halophyticus]|uniref:LytR family transcriptional attenuator n=1 Tax=Tamaricihabitans halophyticus TaxID=1262583 RepID=A0A4R2R0E8_9PSEU|nr:LCP family protein [Tamaricihabitans halophyticus]TCP56092.1 LytR family transcriptional attenuator [Tamaricihabitans halophyticus]
MDEQPKPGEQGGEDPATEQVIFGRVARKYQTQDEAAPRPTPRYAPTPAPPMPPTRRSSPAKIAGRTLVAILSVAALVLTGVAWFTIGQLNESTNTTDALEQVQQAPGAPSANDSATDILLVGNDTRTDLQGNPLPLDQLKALRTEATDSLNTDTLILLRIPKDGGMGSAMSIPRDAYVSINGGEPDKINSAFAKGKVRAKEQLSTEGVAGPELEKQSDQAGRVSLIRTIQDLTGARIDHYAEISLLGFYLLTEAVGGVDVCLNNPVNDPVSGAVFDAGVQTVSGGDALSFVRQRHGLADGDLGRIKRQQAFLASAVNKLLSAGTLTDQQRLGKLADAVSRSVVLDSGLDIFELADQARQMASGTIEFVTMPVDEVGARDDRGQSIVTLRENEVRRFVQQMVTENPGPTSGEEQGEGSQGTAQPSAGTPQRHGFGQPATLRLNGLAPVAPVAKQNPIVADGVPCVD